MTTDDQRQRSYDPALEHTAGARRAIALNDLRSLIRHIVGWLNAVIRGGD